MQVRLATVEDAEGINDVRVAGWQAGYAGLMPAAYLAGLDPRADDERRRGYLRAPQDGVRNWVSEQAGRVAGWCATGPARDADLDATRVHELWALYVDPRCWRGGHGAALVAHALDEVRARGFTALVLWVLDENARGRAFYERQGFRADGAEKSVVLGGEALLHLRYRLEL